MKKIYGITILMIFMAMTGFIQVQGYSPNYLPGGVNYLSEDNFSNDNGWYKSNEPFLVKPFTDYTITVPSDYMEGTSRTINFFCLDNGEYLDDFGIHFENMIYYYDGVDEWYTYTFTTSSDMNYLDLHFENSDGYFSTYGFYGFQLEEGIEFTGYQEYIDGNLLDTSAPYFQSSGTIISYYDSPITLAEIQSALSAYDDIDGDLTENIILVADNYTPNLNVLGSYDILFEVSDSSGNISQITIWVELIDVLKPVFSETGIIQAVYPNVYTVIDIIGMLSASDNYDGDISAEISLVSDGYTDYSSIVGSYEMEFSVTDSSGNTAYHTQIIEVVDNEGPIISGITSVIVGYDEPITEEEVMSNLSFTDNYDLQNELMMILESEDYTAHTGTLGIYTMTFSVTDSSGNTTYQSVSIQVVDEMGPVVYFDSAIVRAYVDAVLALPDFTQILISANELNPEMDYLVTVVYDSYTRNASTPGTYHMTLKYETSDGDSFDKTLEIKVIDKDPDYIHVGTVENNETETALSQIRQYLLTGAATLVLVVSNIVWAVLFKKK